MARDLELGTGSLLIGYDSIYRLLDLYWPHIGQENNSLGHPFRLGFWVQGGRGRVVVGRLEKYESTLLGGNRGVPPCVRCVRGTGKDELITIIVTMGEGSRRDRRG